MKPGWVVDRVSKSWMRSAMEVVFCVQVLIVGLLFLSEVFSTRKKKMRCVPRPPRPFPTRLVDHADVSSFPNAGPSSADPRATDLLLVDASTAAVAADRPLDTLSCNLPVRSTDAPLLLMLCPSPSPFDRLAHAPHLFLGPLRRPPPSPTPHLPRRNRRLLAESTTSRFGPLALPRTHPLSCVPPAAPREPRLPSLPPVSPSPSLYPHDDGLLCRPVIPSLMTLLPSLALDAARAGAADDDDVCAARARSRLVGAGGRRSGAAGRIADASLRAGRPTFALPPPCLLSPARTPSSPNH